MSSPHSASGARRSDLTRWTLVCALILMPLAAHAQITLRPAPTAPVTAASEPWYLAGEGLAFSGNLYYPAGAQVFFDANEMARSGSYRGVPLFSPTNREPESVLFVPVGGGLMQPYERVRAGELAGTFGSSAPTVPLQQVAWLDSPAEAWGPALQRGWTQGLEGDAAPERRPAALGRLSGWLEPRGPLTTALTPTGLNAFYIVHEGQRWFATGRAVLFEPAAFKRAGDYRGFPVYVARDAPPGVIYVSVAGEADGGLVTPYSLYR